MRRRASGRWGRERRRRHGGRRRPIMRGGVEPNRHVTARAATGEESDQHCRTEATGPVRAIARQRMSPYSDLGIAWETPIHEVPSRVRPDSDTNFTPYGARCQTPTGLLSLRLRCGDDRREFVISARSDGHSLGIGYPLWRRACADRRASRVKYAFLAWPVRGHEKVLADGQMRSPLVATRSPRWWPADVPTPH